MAHFKYVRPVAVVVVVVSVAAAICKGLLPMGDLLYREDGLLEDISVGLWIVSALVAIATIARSFGAAGRFLAIWMAVAAVLAALRELDLHIRLNPKYLGDWGVRFRLDWWLSNETSLWIRLGWGVVFTAILALMLYPPTRFWRSLLQLFRQADPVPGILLISVCFLFLGFVVDDILRPVKVVGLDTKQLIEETSEMIGALLYCAVTILLWRQPLDQRSKELKH